MLRKISISRVVLALGLILSVVIIFTAFTKNIDSLRKTQDAFLRSRKGENISKPQNPDQDLSQKLIFVGGMPRSGTTLMRRMLECHPDIRCGPETHVIPDMLMMRKKWTQVPAELTRLVAAGVAPKPLDMAVAKFILGIVVHHASPANIYCNKDPFVLSHSEYVHRLFPHSKFILMLRDGRGSAHSIVTRKVGIVGFDITSYRDVLSKWNSEIEVMYKQCITLGQDICLPVHYEQLVLQPVATTKKIFEFMDIPWIKDVLYHEKHVNETHLSSFEFSTDQVQKPLYLEALTSWCGELPKDVERDMPRLCPMLRLLGYDPKDPNPTYGEPDDFVLGKLKL